MSDGLVRLVNHMVVPGDVSIVRSAKQSYGRTSQYDSFISDKEKKVVEFMMDKRHGTPFEAEVMSFQIRCTIREAREWFRHRFASYNEYSTRFSSRLDDHWVPDGIAVRSASVGGGGRTVPVLGENHDKIRKEFYAAQNDAVRHYENILSYGGAQELASYVYNMAMMTEFTWTVNARSLMNFLSLRMDGAALLELRRKAYKVYTLAEPRIPYTLEMWAKYRQPDMMTDWSDDEHFNIPVEFREE